MKKIATIAISLMIMTGLAMQAHATMELPRIEPAEPMPGFVIDQTFYNTLEYNGTKPMVRVPKLLSSGVSRYIDHSNSQYYAKGATRVVESTTAEDIEHKTTVTLEKKKLFGGTEILVSKSEWGVGEVWATTTTTPTKGDAHVYWDVR